MSELYVALALYVKFDHAPVQLPDLTLTYEHESNQQVNVMYQKPASTNTATTVSVLFSLPVLLGCSTC